MVTEDIMLALAFGDMTKRMCNIPSQRSQGSTKNMPVICRWPVGKVLKVHSAHIVMTQHRGSDQAVMSKS